MQAVILAAGIGSRLGKYTKNNTKCMLEINGRTLIERTLDALDAAGTLHYQWKRSTMGRYSADSTYTNIDGTTGAS
jgi:molybdopterin-guanine dinucleotide biosynthesis protein A